ncbi:fec operon regulator FecR [Janthinobacterium sp. KBS0711]|uniref:FecR domain-containing protein n=1 Tax=Janthinobacterium sp. KBS0711 TaxID=1649647 RepID=UPI000627D72E|nr:FecR family protein [Janthinobacterium sp. KBS0711]KKO64776.1 fec operon regulator FecR [Janthinobacterium sp. KBS0711]TSD72474.1 FecR family protein [Janthinobacterium sp. KBS0711]
MSGAIDPSAARAAAQWLVRLHGGALTPDEQQAFQAWRASDPAHEAAWQRAELVCSTLASVPPALRQTADAAPQSPQRRAVLYGLAGLIAAGPALWLASQSAPWQAWRAGIRTARGEIRHMALPDGTQLVLNTDTAIDVRFDDTARQVLLHAGEIHVATAHDRSMPARPFLVRSSNGAVRALGTHFSVRHLGTVLAPRTQVSVSEGAVEIAPSQAPDASRRIGAGRQGSFDDRAVSALTPLAPHAAGWLQGVLIAERMPLGELLEQVARYRYGVLRCDPALAAMPVDGIFQLNDPDNILLLLQRSLPIRLTRRTRYWISVEAA